MVRFSFLLFCICICNLVVICSTKSSSLLLLLYFIINISITFNQSIHIPKCSCGKIVNSPHCPAPALVLPL